MTFKLEMNQHPFRRLMMAALMLQDGALLLVAMYLAVLVRFGTPTPRVSLVDATSEVFYPQLFLVLLPVWLVLFYGNRLYDYDYLFWGSGEFTRVANSITLGLVFVIVGSYVVKMQGLARGWMLYSWLFAVVLVCGGRLGFRYVVARLRRLGRLSSRTLVAGGNEEAQLLMKRVSKATAAGLLPVGFVDGAATQHEELGGLPNLGAHSHIGEVVARNDIECVLIASSAYRHEQVMEMTRQLKDLPVDIHISSGLFDIITSRVMVKEVTGIPLITLRKAPLTRGNLLVKRVFDLLLAFVGVCVLSLLFAVVAAAIKATSRGPVFFRQQRIGRGGRPFAMYKFRSMILNSDDTTHRQKVAGQIALGRPEDAGLEKVAGVYKEERDPRLTKVGAFIRRYSIDELPQLFNIIRGEMSLVGPRPPLAYEVEMYDDWMRQRLQTTPGLTGLWQVSGRADIPYNEMVKLDLYYMENWSLGLDFSILVRTIPVVLFPKGAY